MSNLVVFVGSLDSAPPVGNWMNLGALPLHQPSRQRQCFWLTGIAAAERARLPAC